MVNLTVFLTIYNQLTRQPKKRIVPESDVYVDAYFRNRTKKDLELSEKQFNECREELINAYKSQCFTSVEKSEKLYDAAIYDLFHCQANNAMSHAWYRDFKTRRGSWKYFDKTFRQLQKAYKDNYIDQLRREFDNRFPPESRDNYLNDLRYDLLEAY